MWRASSGSPRISSPSRFAASERRRAVCIAVLTRCRAASTARRGTELGRSTPPPASRQGDRAGRRAPGTRGRRRSREPLAAELRTERDLGASHDARDNELRRMPRASASRIASSACQMSRANSSARHARATQPTPATSRVRPPDGLRHCNGSVQYTLIARSTTTRVATGRRRPREARAATARLAAAGLRGRQRDIADRAGVVEQLPEELLVLRQGVEGRRR